MTKHTYANLDLLIESRGEGYRSKVILSPAEMARNTRLNSSR